MSSIEGQKRGQQKSVLNLANHFARIDAVLDEFEREKTGDESAG